MSPRPVRLRADNFTPPTRTPWGGTRIRGHYKRALALPPGDAVVGESWEISVEPSFPSRTEDGTPLAALIATAPQRWLGASAARYHGELPLLVKLLDAADDLSVQVHPADRDGALAADESGKPEAWIILDAAPGAGLYLGFDDGVDRSDVARCVRAGEALDALMCFVPVQRGDCFVIAAGTPHAIGAGVTLCEPQHVEPGRRGATYRFWDWNRRYDHRGRVDPAGQPRALDLERALAVTVWSRERGEGWPVRCRSVPRALGTGPAARTELVSWRWFVTERWHGTGTITVEPCDQLWGLCCVGGTLLLDSVAGPLTLARGQSAVVPAAAGELSLGLEGADVLATRLP